MIFFVFFFPLLFCLTPPSVRLGSRASIRTSLLVNSLGLEAGEIKGQAGQGQGQSTRNGRRILMAKASSSSSTASHSPSEQELSDYRSSGVSSGTGSPDSRQAADANRLTAPPCQRCQVQKNSPAKNNGVDPGLQAELESIKAEMNKANATICALQEREKKMKARYGRNGFSGRFDLII